MYYIDVIITIFCVLLFIIVICILFGLHHGLIIRLFNLDRRRNTLVVPVDRVIRILELRRQVREEEYRRSMMNYNEVMSELKNKIIIINPDNSISIGIEN